MQSQVHELIGIGQLRDGSLSLMQEAFDPNLTFATAYEVLKFDAEAKGIGFGWAVV